MIDEIDVKFIPAEHWWKRAKWQLLTDYTSANGEVNVPTGFITDGASIPMFARSYFSPTGQYFGAAIVHDYIIRTTWDWSYGNDQFDREMIALSIPNWRKFIILNTVKFVGWLLTTVLKKKGW